MESWKLEPARDHGLTFRERMASIHRESGLVSTGTHWVWWTFIRAYLAAYHGLEIRGREHLPSKLPFVLVANHSSHLDALALAAPLQWRLRDRAFAIAAGDTFFENLPTAVFASMAINALPLWRKNCDLRDVQALRRRLVEEPCGFILFPEGTRTRTGEMARFKRGIGIITAGSGVPVIPCHLRGAYEALPPQRKVPRLGRITLTVGAPLSFASAPNDADGWRRVAADVEAEVRRLGLTSAASAP